MLLKRLSSYFRPFLKLAFAFCLKVCGDGGGVGGVTLETGVVEPAASMLLLVRELGYGWPG